MTDKDRHLIFLSTLVEARAEEGVGRGRVRMEQSVTASVQDA